MLAAKGYNVTFEMADGRIIRGPEKAELLHDETGTDWPRGSGLLVTFKRIGEPIRQTPAWVRKYFGDEHEVKRGRVALPPRRLSSWRRIGEVRDALYSRRGHFADDYVHTFGERKLFGILPGKSLPVLYVRDGVYRLDGVEDWDWGGFRS